MKSLFVALGVYGGGGGMERFNQRVVKCLSELSLSKRLEARVVVLWDSSKNKAEAPEQSGFVPGGSSKVRTAALFAWHVWRMKPDVILYGHILLSPLGCVARLLSPGSRHLLFVHGREVWSEPFRAGIPVWEKWCVKLLMDSVISVSQFTAERMRCLYRVSGRRFRLLPNAVDVSANTPSRSPQDHPPEELRLLTVTRLGYGEWYKGCDKVIRALPSILSRFPNTHYDIVGRGPLRHELRKLAVDLGVDKHVHLLGYVDDAELDQTYRRAQLLVMPSIGEGFGIVFLEAWQHCLPVVAGNKDASAEVVTHGLNGLCVNPDSVEEIAAAVNTLLKDTHQAATMGNNGRKTVLERYTHRHFRQTLAEIPHQC
jgi:glycosyltransferase involved in cell wall biosynthesis